MAYGIVQHIRGAEKDWKTSNYIPADGEIIVVEFEDGSRRLKVGDGKSGFNALKYTASAGGGGGGNGATYDLFLEEETSKAFLTADGIKVNDGISIADDLFYDTENNLLYLMAGNERLNEGIAITGGGGGSSSTILTLTAIGEQDITAALNTPVYIKFNYSSIRNEKPTGNGFCSITINEKEVYFKSIPQGENEIDISEWLQVGFNDIRVKCSDLYGNYEFIGYSINVITLSLTLKNFNPYQVFNSDIKFDFILTSGITSNTGAQEHLLVYFAINDELPEVIEVPIGMLGQIQSYNIPISKLAHGNNKIVIHAEAPLATGTLPSNKIFQELLVTKEDFEGIDGSDAPMLWSVFETKEIEQGTLISIPFKVYHPGEQQQRQITLIIKNLTDNSEYSKNTLKTDVTSNWNPADITDYKWNISNYPIGNTEFIIEYHYDNHGTPAYISTSHKILIKEFTEVKPISDNMLLYLAAAGRDNREENPARWEYTYRVEGKPDETYKTTFNNFNWVSNGWVNDGKETCLRLNGNATIDIGFKPFATPVSDNGKTIEIDFAIRDVNARNNPVISCIADGVGFEATADSLYLKDTQTLRCNYKEDQKTRVSFVIDGKSSYPFITMYLDGIITAVTQKGSEDYFLQPPESAKTISIGSNTCGIDIFSIRCYNRALTHKEIKDNFISDQANLDAKKELLLDNNIYDITQPYYKNIDYVKVKQRVPTVTFVGTLPAYKGNKKKNSVRMIFERPEAYQTYGADGHFDAPIFDEILNQLDVQGTSSADYPRKNWKVKTAKSVNLIPGELDAKVYCLKVDYAESTGTHNTQNANFIETLYSEPLPILSLASENSTESQVIKNDLKKVRTTIAGFPIVIFHLPWGESEEDIAALQALTVEEINKNTNVKFYSKGNLNFDKGAEQVFAFDFKNTAGELLNAECWEFKENMDPDSFLVPWPSEPETFWEPRYHKNLGDWEDLTDDESEKYDAVAGHALFNEMIGANFKPMYEWVYSTARGTYKNIDGVEVPYATGAPIEHKAAWDVGFETDTDEYRLAKFKNEFTRYFNMHYALIYYVYTFFGLMVDQRAKNMFLTYWEDRDDFGNVVIGADGKPTGKWYPYFYDNDTCFGIDNVGQLKFDYYHEDSGEAGKINTANVFNGQNSVLWCNVRDSFGEGIKAMYQNLRGDSKLTYDKLIEQFISKGSDAWSESIYNEDAHYKYISIATSESDYDSKNDGIIDITAAHLEKARGNGEQHLRYFLKNRIDYCDSKWNAVGYQSDTVSFRAYKPTRVDNPTTEAEIRSNASIVAVEPKLDVEIIPYSTLYFGLKYGSSNPVQDQVRVPAGVKHVFTAKEGTGSGNDLDTYILGASHLSEISDLAPLYPGFVSVDKAVKLKKLKIGDGHSDYYNLNLTSVTLDQNKLLQELDVQNCPNLTGELKLSGCTSLVKVLAKGSGISGIALYKDAIPETSTSAAVPAEYGSSYLEQVELPDTIEFLSLDNQLVLDNTGLVLDGINNLKRVSVTNCAKLNNNDLLAELTSPAQVTETVNGVVYYTVKNLKLDNLHFGFDGFDANGNMLNKTGVTINYMKKFDGIYGYDADELTESAQLFGDCFLVGETVDGVQQPVSGNEFVHLKEKYNNKLNFSYDSMISTISFYKEDGTAYIQNGQPYIQTIAGGMAGRNAKDPVLELGIFEVPTKAATAQYSYEFVGWTTRNGGSVEADALLNIEADRKVYPAFRAILNSYPVHFVNPKEDGNITLQTVITYYGDDAIYTGSTPVKQDVSQPDIYTFTGWEPKPENITGELTCYAQFALADDKWYTITLADISDLYDTTGRPIAGYTLNTTDGTIKILDVAKVLNNNPAIRIPTEMLVGDEAYDVISITGFDGHNGLELIDLQEGLETVDNYAFRDCTKLISIKFPDSLIRIGRAAFQNCDTIKTIMIPAGIIAIDDEAFSQCLKLREITVDAANDIFVVENDCLINKNNGHLIQGLSTTAGIPDTVKSLGSYCFANTAITEITVPEGITEISANAFSRCENLTRVTLPSTIKVLSATCFSWCYALTDVNLPEGLTSIMTYIFNETALEDVTIPASVTVVNSTAFGGIKTLNTVTFSRAEDENGNVKYPDIHRDAFIGACGPDGFTFNVPWSEEQARQAKQDILENTTHSIGYAPWGATGRVTINYSDKTVHFNNGEIIDADV